jgi:hypothetical protein
MIVIEVFARGCEPRCAHRRREVARAARAGDHRPRGDLPLRREPRWQWLSVGSVAAAIPWLASSLLFSWYIANFGTYNKSYGSLGAAIG